MSSLINGMNEMVEQEKLEEKLDVLDVKTFFSKKVKVGNFLMVWWKSYGKISVGFYDPVMSRTNLCLRSDALERLDLGNSELIIGGYNPCGIEINIPYDQIERFDMRHVIGVDGGFTDYRTYGIDKEGIVKLIR